MLKLTVAVLTLALAGTASAAGWRSLRVDGTSEASFAESYAAFEKKLPPSRRYAFTVALQQIWLQGTKEADAEQRTYTKTDYLQQLDGLRYEDVVLMLDPTGKAEERYRAQYYAQIESPGVPTPTAVRISNAPAHPPTTFSGSKTLDAGQSFRAEGRLGGNHH